MNPILAAFLLFSVSVPAFAQPGLINSAASSYAAHITATVSRSNAQLTYLNPRKLKLKDDAKCDMYAELLVEAGGSISSFDTKQAPLRQARIADALETGKKAGCLVPKTLEEQMSPSLRSLWENHRPKLSGTAACVKYQGWADEIAQGTYSDSEKEYSLVKLFTDAREKGCEAVGWH